MRNNIGAVKFKYRKDFQTEKPVKIKRPPRGAENITV